MLLMRGRPSNLKTMAESVDSVGCSLSSSATASAATDLKKTGGNNNKSAVTFTSQSPSEESSIRYGVLPCESDHMYAHHTGDAAKYRELADEVAHLKAMILFHLDLIQQQSEANAAKDKQISALRQENEMLKQRIERMERRVQLQNFKQKIDQQPAENLLTAKTLQSSHIPSASNTNADKSEIHAVTETVSAAASRVPEAFPNVTIKEEPSSSDGEPPKKRIKTLLPVKPKPSLSLSTRRRRSLKSSGSEPDEALDQEKAAAPNPTSNLLDDLINQAVQEGAIISVADASLPNDKIFEAGVVLEPCLLPLQVVEAIEQANDGTNNKISEQEQSMATTITCEDFPIDPEHKRIQEVLTQKPPHREPAYMKKDALLITEDVYVTHVGDSLGSQESLCETNQAPVEVPRWIIKPLTGRASTQGVETLDDEVFTKRHQKHELDEKRRKRWDLQRIREQRQYEKLRARYEGEDRSQDRGNSKSSPRRAGAFENGVTALTSFWPSPEDVTHIQVESWLPVNVFGAPLPNLPKTDFSLPWKFNKPSEEHALRRRQRRSYKAE